MQDSACFYICILSCDTSAVLERRRRFAERAAPLSVQCISWEETKCVSQFGDNATVLVIRAFKFAALAKHCQTLCERSEILTALSPLIVGARKRRKKMQKLICMISTEKNTVVLTTLLTDSLSFFALPCDCHDATFIFSLSILPYFISFNPHPLLPPPRFLLLAGTDAGIFELIGTSRKQRKDR